MTDEDIMLAVKEGGIEKLKILFDRYQLPLYRFFLKSGITRSESEDMVQNVFERIIKYKNSYSQSKTFKPWIYSIAYNIIKDTYSKKNKLKLLQDNVAVAQSFNTIQNIIQMETINQARKALNKLSKEAQHIIWLNWHENLKYKEIAQTLGITETSVRVKTYRAIKKLREEYQKIDNI